MKLLSAIAGAALTATLLTGHAWALSQCKATCVDDFAATVDSCETRFNPATCTNTSCAAAVVKDRFICISTGALTALACISACDAQGH